MKLSLLYLAGFITAASAAPAGTAANGTMLYGFDTVKPTQTLQWVPCFDGLSCTKLEVPIDYANPSLGTTGIAFIKFTGSDATAVSENIVVTPGGPGGSGIDLILGARSLIPQIFPPQYNVVSFDPRGVGNSGLMTDCFPGNEEARTAFNRYHRSEGVSNASSNSLQAQFYSTDIFGEWCDRSIQESNPFGYYVTTPTVARDLLTYVEAEAELAGKPAGESKLWNYGISYGTVVGTTFAAMFPDRVGRMVLDGMVDAGEHYTNDWRASIALYDEVVAAFADTCHAAGPANCTFWGPSPGDILTRLDTILEQLKQEPVALSGLDTGKAPTLATYTDLKALIFYDVYDPLSGFPHLANALSKFESSGNASDIGGFFDIYQLDDPGRIIWCADSYTRNKLVTIDDFRQYVQDTTASSKYVGDLYPLAFDSVLCRAFEIDLPESMTFQGPLPPSASNTSFPILFTSNTLDPVTPIINARKMAEGFPGSVVLAQEAIGHTVINEGGSPCYFQHIQAYFAGVVPPQNVTCPMFRKPFRDPSITQPPPPEQ